MEKNQEKLFDKIKQDVITYFELKIEFFKLSTYERTGKVFGVLSYGLILVFTAFFAFLFIFLSLGFFLGEAFHSQGLGFISVAFIYLIFILIITMNKKRITTAVENEIISSLMSNDDKNNDADNKGPNDNEQQQTPDPDGKVNG